MFITSTKKVVFNSAFVCLFVCLSVCLCVCLLQPHVKTAEWIVIKVLPKTLSVDKEEMKSFVSGCGSEKFLKDYFNITS